MSIDRAQCELLTVFTGKNNVMVYLK